jgi:RNA polymerase sigma-70 factor, ECF subfamily
MRGTFVVSVRAETYIETCDRPVTQSTVAHGDLVRRRSAHETVYRAFVERYQSTVYRVAYGILADRQDADEVAQSVFVKAYFSLASFDGRSSVFVSIYRIVVNECYGFLRKRSQDVLPERESADNLFPASVRITGDAYPAPDGVVSQRDLLNKVLEGIGEEDRYLVLLRELEGYSVAQLAEETGKSEHTIRVALFRTRQRLTQAMAQLSLDAGRARHETC